MDNVSNATKDILEWALKDPDGAFASPGVFFHGTPKLGDYSTITRPLYLTKWLDRAVGYAGYRAKGFVLVLRVEDPEKLVKLPSPTCDCCEDKEMGGWDPCLPAGAREGEDFHIAAILPGREVLEYLGIEIPWYWRFDD